MPDSSQLRVLIVRLGAMGDILHALPAVTALRRARPEWYIGWAVEPQWAPLLRSGPEAEPRTPEQSLVDALHLVPAKSWARRPFAPGTIQGVRALRAELLRARYDAVLDLQGAVRSALLGRLARPARLIGEAAPREPLARLLFSEKVPSDAVHVIEQAADVVRALEPALSRLLLPSLPRDAPSEAWCDSMDIGNGNLLLHPGAGWGAKRWPPERYAEAGAIVARETGARLFVHAAPAEGELGQAVVVRLHALGVEPVVVTPTIGRLIALTRRMSLAVGGDTGPLHLAAALGLPTVGIYGPTDPARNGPFHGRFRVLRDPTSRRDHTRRAAPEAGLLRIAPESVAQAALELLAGAHTEAGRLRESAGISA